MTLCFGTRNRFLCKIGVVLGTAVVCGYLGAPPAAASMGDGGDGTEKPNHALPENSTPTPPQQEQTPSEWGPFTIRSSIEVGYRWITRRGHEDMYRSQVNLGRGPRLFSSTLSMEGGPHSGKVWDRLYLQVDNWGGDPYNTVRLNVEKSDLYRLELNYQNIQYFNSVPVFANPLLDAGTEVSQHRSDSGRHILDARLTLWPTTLVHPYVGFSRSRLQGRGRTTYAAPGDEFVLATDIRETSDEYRGGIEFGRQRFGGFVEQAYRHSKEDWRLSEVRSLLEGNNTRPVLGQPVFLTQLLRNDHLRGGAHISRAFLRWIPHNVLELSGHASYINADNTFTQDQSLAGSFVSFSDRSVFRSGFDGVQATSQLPGLVAGGNVLFQPARRLTVVNSFQVHQFHSVGEGVSQRTLFDAVPLVGPQNPQTLHVVDTAGGRIAFNTRRNTLDGRVELHPMLTLRLGYRFQWQEVLLKPRDTGFGPQPSVIESNQHTPLLGIDVRVSPRLKLSAELEKGYTDAVFYRTMPKNFTRLRVRARTQPWDFLQLSGYANVFGHRHATQGLDLSGHNRGFGFSVGLTPSDRFSLTLDYQRSDVDSNLVTLIPQVLSASRSLYIEDSNFGSLHLDVRLPKDTAFTLGYSVLGTTGDFPVNTHQPYARLEVPLSRRVSWNWDWRYYGYNEKASSLEDYRAHLYSSSLAFRF